MITKSEVIMTGAPKEWRPTFTNGAKRRLRRRASEQYRLVLAAQVVQQQRVQHILLLKQQGPQPSYPPRGGGDEFVEQPRGRASYNSAERSGLL